MISSGNSPIHVILERSEGSVFLLSRSLVRADRFFAYAQNDVGGYEAYGTDAGGVDNVEVKA